MSDTRHRHAAAFTLVEMLLVVAMIALLISLLLPALGRAREMSRRMVCMSNLDQMSKAVLAYAQDHFNWTPDMPRATGPITPINDGTRNLQHVQNNPGGAASEKPEVIGKTMARGYLPLKSEIVYCPSRVRIARYGPDSLLFGWSNWAGGGTVEYSYQHRLQRRLNRSTSSQVLGADLGIMDNYYIGATFIGNVSCGADVAHQDQYYNVAYFDLSVRPFIDKNEAFENMTLYNRPGQVLNLIEQFD